MTENEKRRAVIKKTCGMIDECAEHMKSKIERALECGAVDLADYEDDYVLPCIIFSAILKNEGNRYVPLSEDDIKKATWIYLAL